MEARNFMTVANVLRCYGKRVRVVDVQHKADYWDGLWLGVWGMGSAPGNLLGTLLWSRAEQHVFVVECDGTDTWMDACESCTGMGSAPWFACNVGAPKKKGFRGGDPAAAGKRSGVARARTAGAPEHESQENESMAKEEPRSSGLDQHGKVSDQTCVDVGFSGNVEREGRLRRWRCGVRCRVVGPGSLGGWTCKFWRGCGWCGWTAHCVGEFKLWPGKS